MGLEDHLERSKGDLARCLGTYGQDAIYQCRRGV